MQYRFIFLFLIPVVAISFILRGALEAYYLLKTAVYAKAITTLTYLGHKSQRYGLEGKSGLQPFTHLLARFYPYIEGGGQAHSIDELNEQELFDMAFGEKPEETFITLFKEAEKLDTSVKEDMQKLLSCLYLCKWTRSFLSFLLLPAALFFRRLQHTSLKGVKEFLFEMPWRSCFPVLSRAFAMMF